MDGENKLNDEFDQNMDLLAKKIKDMVSYKYSYYSHKKIEEIANEVCSMTLEAAITSAGNYDPKKEAMPWLMGIAKNKLKDYMKKLFSESKKFECMEDFFSTTGDCFDQDVNLDEKFFKLSDLAAGIHHNIELLLFEFGDLIFPLNKKEQRLMTSLYKNRYSFSEIAQDFDTSKDAIYTQKHRVIMKLKRYIEHHLNFFGDDSL